MFGSDEDLWGFNNDVRSGSNGEGVVPLDTSFITPPSSPDSKPSKRHRSPSPRKNQSGEIKKQGESPSELYYKHSPQKQPFKKIKEKSPDQETKRNLFGRNIEGAAQPSPQFRLDLARLIVKPIPQ